MHHVTYLKTTETTVEQWTCMKLVVHFMKWKICFCLPCGLAGLGAKLLVIMHNYFSLVRISAPINEARVSIKFEVGSWLE